MGAAHGGGPRVARPAIPQWAAYAVRVLLVQRELRSVSVRGPRAPGEVVFYYNNKNKNIQFLYKFKTFY